jgi:hypothetical protein
VVRILAAGDSAPEADETFHVSLSNPRGATLSASDATSVVLDDDQGPAAGGQPTGAGGATVSIASGGSGQEGAELVFRVTRGGDVSGQALVDYYTWSEQASAADFSGPTSGTVRFDSGQAEALVRIAAAADGVQEGAELFHVALSNGRGATIGVQQGDGWIMA